MQCRPIPAILLAVVLVVGLVGSAPHAGITRPVGAPSANGDRYVYGARWNGIPVASAELVIAADHDAPGRAVHLRGSARTNAFLDLFWRMRSSFDAVVSLDPPEPGTFYLEQNENSRHRETWIERDDARTRLVGRLERPGKRTRHGEAELRGALHDPASVAYLIRTLPADANEPSTYEVFEGHKIYSMRVTPMGEETIRAMGSIWQARKLRLGLTFLPRTEREARKKKPPKIQRANLWVSADDERVLLRMEAGTWWGRVTIALTGRAPVTEPAPST